MFDPRRLERALYPQSDFNFWHYDAGSLPLADVLVPGFFKDHRLHCGDRVAITAASCTAHADVAVQSEAPVTFVVLASYEPPVAAGAEKSAQPAGKRAA